MKQIFSFRKNAFWLIDSLLGNKVKNHLQEITSILENPNDEKSLKLKNKNLKMLLEHASNTIPYYSNFKNIDNIESFKVLKKTDIIENFDAFKSKKYIGKNNYKVSTSGSTGLPFILFQNKNKKLRNIADNLYFLNKVSFDIGERLYYLEAWRGIGMNSKLSTWAKNLVYIDVSNFNNIDIKTFLERLERYKLKKAILGVPSSLETICNYLDSINSKPLTHLNVDTIIGISEYFSSSVKNSLDKYFKARVVSRYSTEELGIISQQINSHDDFIVNWASYHVEILKMDSDEKVEFGEIGRIVITDLFNYCMPLIRYDTGDVGAFNHPSLNVYFPKLKTIEGRKMDLVYDSQGNSISPHLIYTKFHKYYDLLKQYQFIQQAEKDYEVKLNLKGNNFSFENELIENIKNDFGWDTNVIITYVDEIPPLASGKRRKVVNNYVKTKSN